MKNQIILYSESQLPFMIIMVLNAIFFHFSKNSVEVNYQLNHFNIIFTRLWFVHRVSGLNQNLHSKYQITVVISFVDISKIDTYLTLNASNLWHSTLNRYLKGHRINNLKNLTINNKIPKIHLLHHISANSHIYDAITFVGPLRAWRLP